MVDELIILIDLAASCRKIAHRSSKIFDKYGKDVLLKHLAKCVNKHTLKQEGLDSVKKYFQDTLQE